jgi:signal peptidase I
MSKTTKEKTLPGAAPRASAYAGAARAMPAMALAWIGLLVATAIAALCPRFTGYYAVYLLVTIGLSLGALAFLKAIYRDGKAALHPAFKKFLGYGLVLHYAAAALPRVDWANEGLIGQGRVTYMFILSALCLAAGLVLFVAMGRPAAYAALGLIEDEEVKDKELRKKRAAENRKKGFWRGALEWVDALGFAAILVILINTFVFQLYEIPSESMVPSFLIKDRPFTSKLSAGPRIPLTDWRLPFLRLPARGDIITLSNPRYEENQSVNPKKYLAQLVSMVTFTAVNIDRYLPNGSEKADPLVKRVVGLPGEKLMMVDDQLYSKRPGDAAFAPVEADKAWARVDLWKESPELVAKIKEMPIDQARRAVLDAWDRRKREADPAALASSIAASARAIVAKASASQSAAFLAAVAKSQPDAYQILAADISALAKPEDAKANAIASLAPPLASARDGATDIALALSIAAYPKLKAALEEYAACPAALAAPGDAYEKSGRALNLMIKDNYLKMVSRDVELIASGADVAALTKDPKRVELGKQSAELDFYMNGNYLGLYDSRNMPAFPSGDAYLGPQQYFAMGDNRYNSLDFRYKSGNFVKKGIDPADPASAQYLSYIEPFALDLRFIEGYAIFRIWPLSRVGAIR